MDTSKEYIKMCEHSNELQSFWKPNIGDYILRRYTVFGEPLDSQIWKDPKDKEEIIILHYHSNLPQYWHSVTVEGKSRIFTYQDTCTMIKATHSWLPRQDQLQNMITILPHELIREFSSFCNPPKNITAGFTEEQDIWTNQKQCEYPKQFTSMEQLWLSFVMQKLFDKYWNGTDWSESL
jgi:hypothetical protein